MIDTMDANFARRRTGLTRAKHIERLTLWLGLPLLLALLCLTAGIVNYAPVHRVDTAKPPSAVPAQPETVPQVPRANPMPMRGESALPQASPEDMGQSIEIDPREIPNLS